MLKKNTELEYGPWVRVSSC